MLFNSLQFILFFIAVTLWFFMLRTQKNRILLLLIASCYFYMSLIPEYILILGGIIVVDYFAGIKIEMSRGHSRKMWLLLSLAVNIGTLGIFKYYNFFVGNIHDGLLLFHRQIDLPYLNMALPIGLSFHTFQAMSYTIDVSRGKQPAEKNFPVYALYVMFYPQLVAGPIERPHNIIPQLKEFRLYNFDHVKEGLARMLWGMFKKVVIADRVAMAVDYVHTQPASSSSYVYITGAVLYSFQIYCDFSGYSDIALGAAKVMNMNLMENFNQPYLSATISNFWSRWHISLSSWFRDYVYIPLGGNRKGETRRKINVFIVFLLSGLWHGANWTFAAWGGLHGLLVIIFPRRIYATKNSMAGKILDILRICATFLAVAVLWIFFRSKNISAAFDYIGAMCSFSGGSNYTGISNAELVLSFFMIAIMLLREKYFPSFVMKSNRSFYMYVMGMSLVCYYLGVFAENQFIYFQF